MKPLPSAESVVATDPPVAQNPLAESVTFRFKEGQFSVTIRLPDDLLKYGFRPAEGGGWQMVDLDGTAQDAIIDNESVAAILSYTFKATILDHLKEPPNHDH